MTALFERLAKFFSTSAFRLAVMAVALFLVLAAMLAGVLFWQTNKVLTEQVLTVLRAESDVLKAEAASGKARDPSIASISPTTGTVTARITNRMVPRARTLALTKMDS